MKRIRKKPSRYDQDAEDGKFGGSSEISPSKLSVIPSINSTVAEGGRMKRIRKKSSRYNIPDVENPTQDVEDGTFGGSSEISPSKLSLIPSINSIVAKGGRMKRIRKKTSRNNLPQRSACENSIDEVGANSSNDITPADLSIIPFEDYSALSVIPSVNSFGAGNN